MKSLTNQKDIYWFGIQKLILVKHIFSFLLIYLLFSIPVFSQIPVTDAAANVTLEALTMQESVIQISNYTEYAQQTSTLATTLETIKEMRDVLSEISSVVSEVVYYKDIIATQLNIIKYEIDYITTLREDGSITTTELSNATAMLGDILIRSEDLLSLATDIISQGDVDMESSDRIQLLKEISIEMSGLFMDMTLIMNKMTYVSKDRTLNKILKGW